jgi:predicted metal-dependent phosphoesterase TrpH
VIDLHTHSTVSDGSEAPERVLELAAAAGCSAVALTDHDSFGGLEAAARRAEALGVRLVPGCEVSCRSPAGSMHVLVYFADPAGSPLADELARLRQDRVARNKALAERLATLGVHVDYGSLAESAGGESGLGRPHFAQALVSSGAASSIEDAFDRWLAAGRPAYVPKARVTPEEVAQLARASGGVAVLAHPLTLSLEPPALDSLVGELAAAGFSGIEAIYGRYTPEEREGLALMAARHGLVATGGSDFHGTFKPGLSVGTGTGDLDVPDSILDELASRTA